MSRGLTWRPIWTESIAELRGGDGCYNAEDVLRENMESVRCPKRSQAFSSSDDYMSHWYDKHRTNGSGA